MDDIHEYLLLKGVEATSVHGGRAQEEREQVRLVVVVVVVGGCLVASELLRSQICFCLGDSTVQSGRESSFLAWRIHRKNAC